MKAFFDNETEILKDPRIGKRDIKVYLALILHADSKTGECWPSRSRISKLTGIHESHVSSSTNRLVEFGYIQKRHTSGKSNKYRIVKPVSKTAPVSKSVPVAKSVPTGIQNGYQPVSKTATQNKPITDQEQTNRRKWCEYTYERFRKLNSKPGYSEDFQAIWKSYKSSCSQNKSEEGNKHRAWFCFLQRVDEGFESSVITEAINAYVRKKTKAESKQAHLSTLLNDPELIEQFHEEIKDEASRTESIRIQGFENRFQ